MTSWSDAVREFRRRPGRSLLSLFSVVIAVGAIVSVASATATTRKAYRQVFEALSGRADLEVVSRGRSSFKESAVEEIKSLPGVRAVVPVFNRSTNLWVSGETPQDTKKVKMLAVGILPDEPESLFGFALADGHWPTKPDEVMLEAGLAKSLNLKLGDQVKLLTSRLLVPHTICGLVKLENAVSLHQGGMLLVKLDRLQSLFRSRGRIDALHLYLDDPKQASAVIAEASRKLPEELQISEPSSRSGLAEDTLVLTEVSLNLASALSCTTALFIVLSVFLMNVGERRRQLSILRAVGATRRQIVGLVSREALLLGLCGTLLGIPAGIYGGRLLIRTMAITLNVHLPESPDLRWVFLVGSPLGPVICLLAAWFPARRAGRVSPLEGMRPVVTMQPQRSHRRATWVGVVGSVLTGLMAIGAVRGTLPIWISVLSVVFGLVSMVFLIPVCLKPAVQLLGWPVRRWLGVEGEMAQRLVLRHSGRSTLTIGVLLIAVGAAVGISNAAFSVTRDIRDWYEATITADYLLRPMMPDMTGQDAATMPESLAEEVAHIPGVERLDPVNFFPVDAAGNQAMLVARDFKQYTRLPLSVLNVKPQEVLDELLAGDVVLSSVLAEKVKVGVGDTLHVTRGEQGFDFRVAGLATEYTFGGAVINIDRQVAQRLFEFEGASSFLIKTASKPTPATQAALQKVAGDNGLLLQSFAEVLQIVDAMVAGVTGGLWVLLALLLVVGALGVINTLVMNVLEQTRELGMLRAIGMQRSQVLRMVVAQAAIIGVLGVLTGGTCGMSLARMINYSLGSLFGRYMPFALRPEFILLLVVTALAVVLLAAIPPARRAVGLNMLQAMRQE